MKRSPRIVVAVIFTLVCLLFAAIYFRRESAESPDLERIRSEIPRYDSVLIADVPHILQEPDFCGEACAAMYLQKLGRHVGQHEVFNLSGLDPIEGRGCYTLELANALQNVGFECGAIWHEVDAQVVDQQIEQQFQALHKDLAAGTPSIVCMRYDDNPEATEHFRLILGYDRQTDEVIYHEPAIREGSYLRMKRQDMLALWPLKYNAETWTVIRLQLEPNEIVHFDREPGFSDADYAQHVMRLKEKLPSESFHLALQRPFVVVGDESADEVNHWASGTIQWAVNQIKSEYFEKEPLHIVDIWLFKDKDSYESHTGEIFRTRPGTPFGYYSSRHKALVMNISTGGGTLVHELVHPFIESNFPQCPSWFNEGLASLYEQCSEKDGRIWGLTNWRLRNLQGIIADKEGDGLPSFKELCGTTTYEFYEDDVADNYAQARYLCYYLQERGKLGEFYHAFHSAADEDPTGYQTLKKVLNAEDMADFQKKWQQYVMQLRF